MTSAPTSRRLDRVFDTRPLRSSPDFRRLWVGTSTARFGHQMTVVAVLYQVWELTGSPFWTGAVGLANALPITLFGLIGGSLADSMDRRRLVLAARVGIMAAASLLAAQALASLDSLPLVLTLVAAQASFAGLAAPASRTFVPRLLPRNQVAAGLAVTNVSFQASMLIGPAAAGLIIGWWGVAACYAADAAAMLVALYSVFRLPSMPPEVTSDGTGSRPGIRAIVDGGRFILGRPVLRGS